LSIKQFDNNSEHMYNIGENMSRKTTEGYVNVQVKREVHAMLELLKERMNANSFSETLEEYIRAHNPEIPEAVNAIEEAKRRALGHGRRSESQ